MGLRRLFGVSIKLVDTLCAQFLQGFTGIRFFLDVADNVIVVVEI